MGLGFATWKWLPGTPLLGEGVLLSQQSGTCMEEGCGGRSRPLSAAGGRPTQAAATPGLPSPSTFLFQGWERALPSFILTADPTLGP